MTVTNRLAVLKDAFEAEKQFLASGRSLNPSWLDFLSYATKVDFAGQNVARVHAPRVKIWNVHIALVYRRAPQTSTSA